MKQTQYQIEMEPQMSQAMVAVSEGLFSCSAKTTVADSEGLLSVSAEATIAISEGLLYGSIEAIVAASESLLLSSQLRQQLQFLRTYLF